MSAVYIASCTEWRDGYIWNTHETRGGSAEEALTALAEAHPALWHSFSLRHLEHRIVSPVFNHGAPPNHGKCAWVDALRAKYPRTA